MTSTLSKATLGVAMLACITLFALPAYAGQCESVDTTCPNVVFLGSTVAGSCPVGQKRTKEGCVDVATLQTACASFNADTTSYTPLGESGKCMPSCPSGYKRLGVTGKGGMQVRCIKCASGYSAVLVGKGNITTTVQAAPAGKGSGNTTQTITGSTGKGSGNNQPVVRCKAVGGTTLKQPSNRVYLELKYAPVTGTVSCPVGTIAAKGDCVTCSNAVQASYSSGYAVLNAGDLRLCVPVGAGTESNPNCCVGYKKDEESEPAAPAPAPEADDAEAPAPEPSAEP